MVLIRNIIAFILGIVTLCSFAYFLAKDVYRTSQVSENAKKNRRRAEHDSKLTPENGWFPALKDPIFSFENTFEGWFLDSEGQDSDHELVALKMNASSASQGSQSLEVPVEFPVPSTILLSWEQPKKLPSTPVAPEVNTRLERLPWGLKGVRFISFDVYIPEEVQGFVGCLFFLKDKDGRWYQARSREGLIPGKWSTTKADIRGGSPDVEPLGHLGQWDENQASQIRTLGITVYGDKAFKGSVLIDNFRGWMRPERFQKEVVKLPSGLPEDSPDSVAEPRRKELAALMEKHFPAGAEESKPAVSTRESLAILNIRTVPVAPLKASTSTKPAVPSVALFRPFEVGFELNRRIGNPFDPNQADVRAQVRTPSGKEYEVLGFWYQDFERRKRFEADELSPVGRPGWRVRITPRELGDYEVSISVTLDKGKGAAKEEKLKAAPLAFVAVPSEERGFLRVSKRDPYYFEFEDGTFFYPIGHNIHSPVDLRCWETVFKKPPPLNRGLGMYEDFFPKMAAAGENVGEVWMSSWWMGIEWTKKWRNFHGMGRYSLERAWLLDQLMMKAHQHGIYIHLIIDNHGKFSQWCDWEWDQNPFNRYADGNGPVVRPSQYFSNLKSREMHKWRMRYIAARWGYDPTLFGMELVSEMDLVGDGKPPNHSSAGRRYCRTREPRAWIKEMLGAIREYDPYDHPLTNHYASDYNQVDIELANTPAFDYIVCDAYRQQPGYAQMAKRTASFYLSKNVKKPFWITEYGGNWNATNKPRLEADLHGGLWASWMTHTAGTPLFWWYDYIDQDKKYFHFRAFANFIKGEDRRGLAGNSRSIYPSRQNGGLAGMAYQWSNGAYLWIYDRQAMNVMPLAANRPLHSKVQAELLGVPPGTYNVEYWDTYKGVLIEQKDVVVTGSRTCSLKFPDFRSDIAVKVKPKTMSAD